MRGVDPERVLRAEADDVHAWANGPGDRYDRHVHAYTKILRCLTGSIDFILDDRTIHLDPGARMVLPAGTPHALRFRWSPGNPAAFVRARKLSSAPRAAAGPMPFTKLPHS